MTVTNPWLICFSISTLLLLLGATSALVNSRLWISEPLACAAFGVALGPLGLGLLDLDPAGNPHAAILLREVARVTLAIAVLAAAMRLPAGWMIRQWRGLATALGPGLILMWLASAAIVSLSFGLSWGVCALIGAVISPTDPVLSAPVVAGELAHVNVPPDLRHAITAESAANDGLAAPIVMLPLMLLFGANHGEAASLWAWFYSVVLWQAGTAVILGAGAGYSAGKLLGWAGRQTGVERSSILTIALALALATLGGLQSIGSNGVLGAFAAGAMLNNAYQGDTQQHQEHFNEAITRFFDLPIMVLFGAAIPWADWRGYGWQAVVFAIGVLLLRRMPAWLLLRRGMVWAKALPDNIFAGWFGPVGAAAMFYALDAQQMTGLTILWPIVSLAVAASVVAHGVTATHAALWLGRYRRR